MRIGYQYGVDPISSKSLEQIMTVANLKFNINWPEGHINSYLQVAVQKKFRKEPGVLNVIFTSINEDKLRIDYDPNVISNFEIIQILNYFNLEIGYSEAC